MYPLKSLTTIYQDYNHVDTATDKTHESAYEMELCNVLLQVLHNDVMSHVRTMESLNQAGKELLEVGSGDCAHGLHSRLDQLNESWEFVRCETEQYQLEFENRLSQVMCFTSNQGCRLESVSH